MGSLFSGPPDAPPAPPPPPNPQTAAKSEQSITGAPKPGSEAAMGGTLLTSAAGVQGEVPKALKQLTGQ